ncbi:Detected protein of confused Function [Hibiscus syriacus]|uniref:Detected protein of confused Function n=1 Tax=Hibiscus syriacus TaxID=106335 RepID=A0A6A3ARG5_HIBSY|nr:Detected protein of confused Function [Hibiscus syriacus]
MATRTAVRYISRRFSSGSGKVLSEEEKAAENVYIQKTEREKLEKLARRILEIFQEQKPREKSDSGLGGTAADANLSGTTSTSRASAEKASSDKFRNYVLAGVATLGAAVGWYLSSKDKKQEAKE